MKKIGLLIALSFIFGTLTFSQQIEKGIKGGLNLATLSKDGNNDKNLKLGLNAGVFAKIPFTETLAVQPELLYANKGIKLYADQSVIQGDTKFSLNYIEVPLKLIYNLSEDFEFQFGPYFSYLLNANTTTTAEVLDYLQLNSENDIDRKRFKAFDVGLSAGIGFTFEPVIVGFNYNIGLSQVARDGDIAYTILENAKNRVIQFYVGLKF